MSNFPRVFGNLVSPVALSYLDDNFSALEGASTSTVSIVGASLIGVIQSGTGAVARTVSSKLGEVLSAADFGFDASASAAVNAAAIMSAYTALGGTYGGEIRLPRGQFNVAPDVIAPATRNVRIRGEGPGMSYDGASRAGTSLIFDGGTVAFDFTTWSGGSSGGFYELCDLNIYGSNTTDYGIKANGQVLIDNVTVNNFELADTWLFDLVNTSRLQNFSLGGSAIGLLVGASTGGGSNTTFSCENFTIRQNTVGVQIYNARGASFRNGVIESNTDEGLIVHKLAGVSVNDIDFFKVHFEENQYTGGAGYQILITGDTPGTDKPSRITFDQCAMVATLPTKAIHVESGSYVRIINPGEMTSGTEITLASGSNNCLAGPLAGLTVTLADSGTENYQAVVDASGLQYQPLTTPSFTATLTGCTTSPTYTVKYTKVGNVVTLEVPAISGTSNDTTKTLTGMPASIQNATSKQGLWCAAVVDSGGSAVPGLVRITGGVIIYFADNNGTAFTNSGSFSADQVSITYLLA